MTPDDDSVPAGNLIFAIGFVILSAWLFSQIGSETKFSSSGKLFAQPRFWPAVGVGGMLLFGLAHLVTAMHQVFRRSKAGNTADALVESLTWLRALEYLGWFMAYVYAVPSIGYLLATIFFTFLLCLRAGYRKPRLLAIAVAMGVGIVVVFKAGLSVKIPGGAIYEYLPDSLRNFMIINF